MRTVLQFHGSLLLRDYGGRSIVGWFGVVMLMFGFTGLVLWWPRPGRWRQALSIRRTHNPRIFLRDLHSVAGIWSAIVLMLISFSGIYLAFPLTLNAVMNTLFATRDLRAPPVQKITPMDGAVPFDPDAILKQARDAVPESRLVSLSLPQKPDQPYRVTLRRRDEADGTPPVNVFIDPWKQTILEIRDPRHYSIAETIIAWQHAIHAGEAFGWIWRLLVFIGGLMPALFAYTGVSMWMMKRKRPG
jgi:uncharacterized iron-regulated membrane protein